MVHPAGMISVALQLEDGVLSGTVTLPPNTPGTLYANDQVYDIAAGGTLTF